LKSDVYLQMWQINRSLDRVIEGLEALRRHPAFRRRQLDRCRALSQETRALINSQILGVIETIETEQAGRLYGKRLARERKDEQGE
jgi:hypothetical protein